MSGYNALTKGPMKDHVDLPFDPTQDADFAREERQSKKVDLEKAKQMAESTQAKEEPQAYEETDRYEKKQTEKLLKQKSQVRQVVFGVAMQLEKKD